MSLPKPFLQQVDELVQLHLADKQILSILSEHLHLSPSQIFRKIKKQTGLSPSVYIRNRRLEKAHQLILRTDITLSQISDIVGFQQLAYFSRCFSEYYGFAPSTLRKK